MCPSRNTKPVRTFLAVRLPLDIAATLNKKARHRAGDLFVNQLKWSAPQHQHITLRFLGDSQPAQLDALIDGLTHALEDFCAFDCMTGRFEFFPDARRPRVLALGVHSGQELRRLAERCEQIALACGFDRELRHFRPHVTVGRFRDHQHVTHSHFFNLPSYRMNAAEVVLIQSEQSSEGTSYKTLHTFPLQPLAISA